MIMYCIRLSNSLGKGMLLDMAVVCTVVLVDRRIHSRSGSGDMKCHKSPVYKVYSPHKRNPSVESLIGACPTAVRVVVNVRHVTISNWKRVPYEVFAFPLCDLVP